MRLVVDTNVLFSALIAGGKTRELLLRDDLDLFVPEYFFTEALNHRETIEEKTRLSSEELETLIGLLFESVTVTRREEFAERIEAAQRIIGDVDPDDVPFLALALHHDAGVWSDDSDFREQSRVTVYTTSALVDLLESG